MKKLFTLLMVFGVCGVAIAGTINPYAKGKNEQSSSDIVKCMMYGMMTDGTIYPVRVDTDGTIYTSK